MRIPLSPVIALAGSNSTVQVSTNLLTWTPVYTNSGAFAYTDPKTNAPSRFYCVVMP